MMAESKRLTVRFPPRLYAKMEEAQLKSETESIPDFIRVAVEYYIENMNETKKSDVEKQMDKYLDSEAGEIWFTTLLNKVLMKEANKDLGLD